MMSDLERLTTATTTAMPRSLSRIPTAPALYGSSTGDAMPATSPMDPIHVWSLLQLYGNQLLREVDDYPTGLLETLPERLASLLVFLGEEHGGLIQNVSYRRFADLVDGERETVAAILRAFERQGLVRLGYRQIEIVHAQELAEFAGW
jgi:hypothetical protein